LELSGGPGGQGSSDYPVAGRLPGHPGSIEGEGLAGTCPAHHDLCGSAGADEGADHVALFFAKGRVGVDDLADQGDRDSGERARQLPLGPADERRLYRQQFGRGVDLLPVCTSPQRHDVTSIQELVSG